MEFTFNPLDCKIWGDIQQQVHQSQLHSIDELEKRLLDVWHVMDQSVVDSVIDEWHKHLRAFIAHYIYLVRDLL